MPFEPLVAADDRLDEVGLAHPAVDFTPSAEAISRELFAILPVQL